nr:hypothetical protein FFPRI1PSEUD_49310 [Pseudomonas sp. FFPRI_1]
MIVSGHRGALQLLLPDAGDQALQFVASSLIGAGRLTGGCIREQRVVIQAAIGQASAAGRTLQLAAGGLRQRAGVEQHHHTGGFLAGFGHGLADGLDQRLRGQDLLHAAADLRGDADAFLALVGDREGRHPPLAHHFHFALDGLFDVLGIQVVPAHDQQVLEAPGDVQLAVAHEAQVAGTQPGTTGVRNERLGRGLGVAPVTMGNAWTSSPDFADAVVRQFAQLLRIHHQHRVLRLTEAAAHHRATRPWLGAVLRQGLVIQVQRRDALAAHATGDEQGGFGQAIGGQEVVRGKTAGVELLGEAFQGVEADRLGTGIGHAPAAQVEAFQG